MKSAPRVGNSSVIASRMSGKKQNVRSQASWGLFVVGERRKARFLFMVEVRIPRVADARNRDETAVKMSTKESEKGILPWITLECSCAARLSFLKRRAHFRTDI